MIKERVLKRFAAVLLTAALVTGAFPVPAIAAGGTQEAASEDASFFQMLWEEVQKSGEDMVTFPSRITDTLDPDEAAYYGFYLEHPTDINLLLESDYPCYLMLCQKDQPVNVQTLPFATQKIEESGVPAGYYQIYVIPQEEFEKEQNSFTLSLGTFEEAGEEPDYSDFDPAGKVFNIVAPMYLLGGSDYPKYDKYGNNILGYDKNGQAIIGYANGQPIYSRDNNAHKGVILDVDPNNNGKDFVGGKTDGKKADDKCTTAKAGKTSANVKTDAGKNTGDNSVLAIVAGVVALAGAAFVVTKKRK